MESRKSSQLPSVLLCANHVGAVPNGPAKFANLLLRFKDTLSLSVNLQVLTPDTTPTQYDGADWFHRTKVVRPGVFGGPSYHIALGRAYRSKIKELERATPFDLIIFNELTPSVILPQTTGRTTIGMINDAKTARPSLSALGSIASFASRAAIGLLQRRAARKLDYVVFNSQYLADHISSAWKIPAQKQLVLYKAVDMDNLAYQPRAPDGTATINVLFLKTHALIGGLVDVYRALLQLKEYTIKLTVIGPQPSEVDKLIGPVPNTVGHLSIEKLGRQPQTEVVRHLMAAHIFCVPSHSEALGVANIEAMACGVPVVTSTVGGIPEVTDGGRNAWVSAPGDVDELTSSLRACIEQSTVALRKVKAARAFVHNRFAAREMIDRFTTICLNCKAKA